MNTSTILQQMPKIF